MGCCCSAPIPPDPRLPVPPGKIRICVAGYTVSTHTGKARRVAGRIAAAYPDKFETWFYFPGFGAYFDFLHETFDNVPFPEKVKGHATAPFVWLERPNTGGPVYAPNVNEIEPIGGREELGEWVAKTFPENPELVKFATDSWSLLLDMFHDDKGDAPKTTAYLGPPPPQGARAPV